MKIKQFLNKRFFYHLENQGNMNKRYVILKRIFINIFIHIVSLSSFSSLKISKKKFFLSSVNTLNDTTLKLLSFPFRKAWDLDIKGYMENEK